MMLTAEQTKDHARYNQETCDKAQKRISTRLKKNETIVNIGWTEEECLAVIRELSDGMVSFMYHHGLNMCRSYTSSYRKAIHTVYEERIRHEAEKILIKGE